MPDVEVRWSIVAGGGQLTSSTNITGSNGQASNTWKLGVSGTQTVYAKVLKADGSDINGSPGIFTASFFDSLSYYKSIIPGKWTTTWYHSDGSISQVDKFELYANGTGKRLSTLYSTGFQDYTNAEPDPFLNLVWNVTSITNAYQMSYYDQRWRVQHAGRITPQLQYETINTITKKD